MSDVVFVLYLPNGYRRTRYRQRYRDEYPANSWLSRSLKFSKSYDFFSMAFSSSLSSTIVSKVFAHRLNRNTILLFDIFRLRLGNPHRNRGMKIPVWRHTDLSLFIGECSRTFFRIIFINFATHYVRISATLNIQRVYIRGGYVKIVSDTDKKQKNTTIFSTRKKLPILK